MFILHATCVATDWSIMSQGKHAQAAILFWKQELREAALCMHEESVIESIKEAFPESSNAYKVANAVHEDNVEMTPEQHGDIIKMLRNGLILNINITSDADILKSMVENVKNTRVYRILKLMTKFEKDLTDAVFSPTRPAF